MGRTLREPPEGPVRCDLQRLEEKRHQDPVGEDGEQVQRRGRTGNRESGGGTDGTEEESDETEEERKVAADLVSEQGRVVGGTCTLYLFSSRYYCYAGGVEHGVVDLVFKRGTLTGTGHGSQQHILDVYV